MREAPKVEAAAEFERLRLLRSLKIDDAHLDESLQRIVERVGPLYGTKLCMINLILEHVQYTKAWCGPLPPDVAASRTIPRGVAICDHVVASHVPLVIEDMQAAADWADHPVARGYGIRFYAGVPLVANSGHVLGTLCLLDTEPGTITAEGLEALQFFASRTAAELELAGEHEHSRRLQIELEETLRYAETLSEMMVELQTLTDPERVGERALGDMSRTASLAWAALIAVGAEGAWAPYRTGQLPASLEGLAGRGMRRGSGPLWKLIQSRAEGHVLEAALEHELVLLVDVPVSSPKLPYFLLVGRKQELGPWSTQDRLLMECTARAVAVALHRCLRLSELESAALTDELTGLGNRRAFEAFSARVDPGRSCRVIMADLARFKKLNDTMGHAVGDLCLRAVAQALLREMRPADEARVFRYGGDEFVIVLPDPAGAAAQIGTRLEAVVGEAVRDYLGLGLRLDVGEALVPAEAATLAEGLALADSRMYEVKRSRRHVPLAAGARLGPYEVVGPLGSGGMGEVYRARDPRLGRDVAVKVLSRSGADDEDRIRRFELEAQAAGTLNHPNIVAVYDVGSHEGSPYVVSELLEGATLRDRLAGAALSLRSAVDYALQVARGLAAAHEKGIVHRDLKPENVFVTRDGRVKILDFGLAKLMPAMPAHDAATGSLAELGQGTTPGTILGTIGYMSPEQIRGRPVDPRTDIFSFGAVLYEMLSGRRAFAADTAADSIAAILGRDPPPVTATNRDVAPALDEIVRRCLRKEPAERFHSAHDLGLALESVLASPRPTEAAAGRQPSVAVLPFKDLSRGPDNEHLGLGLADATITELALLRSLVVRPTSCILRYHGQAVDPQRAGQELGVDAVVDGSFQRAGPRLRVTVQVVASSDGRPLWATKIDASLDDVFEVQDEVSRRVAQALEVELTPVEQRRLGGAGRGAQPRAEAYELYLKGRVHLFRETPADMQAAAEWFDKAREADPRFAPAWAGLADAYARMAYEFEPEGDWYGRAQAMCEKALSLDPALPEGRYIRARLLWSPQGGFDHAAALRELMAAVSARPNLDEAHVRLGGVLFHVGLLDEAAQHLDRGLAISPGHALALEHKGAVHFHRCAFEQAISTAEASVAPSLWGDDLVAHSHLRLGRLPETLRTVERMEQRSGEALSHPLRGLIAALSGDDAEARRRIRVTVENKKSYGHYHHAQYDVACIYARLGDAGEALRWLRDAAGNGYPCAPFFEKDPLLAPLHGEQGFRGLLEELLEERRGYHSLYADLRAASGGETRAPSSA